MTRALWLALLAAGCDGVFTHPGAGLADAPGAGDAPNAPPPAVHHYVIASQQLPDLGKSAQTLGLDLDGDATIDNTFGAAMNLLAQQGFDPSAAANYAIRHGVVLSLVELTADSYSDGPATFTLFTGVDPQPSPCPAIGLGIEMCGDHLRGDGTFDVYVNTARDAALRGELVAGELLTERAPASADAKLAVSIAFYQDAVPLGLVGARVAVSMPSDEGIASGVIAGGIPKKDVQDHILPELAAALDAELAMAQCTRLTTDWPQCGCPTANKQITKLVMQFDTYPDCMIKKADLRDNPVAGALFEPDLPNDEVSFGIGFTAVKATFTP